MKIKKHLRDTNCPGGDFFSVKKLRKAQCRNERFIE